MARPMSPYVSYQAPANIRDIIETSRKVSSESDYEVGKQRDKMVTEFRNSMKELKKKALKKGASTPIAKALKLGATLFGGPTAAGITSGLTGLYEGRKQREASEGLLDIDEGRWGKTFLKDPSKKYLDWAEEQQISQSDVIEKSLMSALTSAIASEVVGGKEGLGKQMVEAGSNEKLLKAHLDEGLGIDLTWGPSSSSSTPWDVFTDAFQNIGSSGISEKTKGMTTLFGLLQSLIK